MPKKHTFKHTQKRPPNGLFFFPINCVSSKNNDTQNQEKQTPKIKKTPSHKTASFVNELAHYAILTNTPRQPSTRNNTKIPTARKKTSFWKSRKSQKDAVSQRANSQQSKQEIIKLQSVNSPFKPYITSRSMPIV